VAHDEARLLAGGAATYTSASWSLEQMVKGEGSEKRRVAGAARDQADELPLAPRGRPRDFR
jgi:hypothetical protein